METAGTCRGGYRVSQAGVFRFQCASCGEWHDGAPGLSCEAPDYYFAIAREKRATDASLDSDLCMLEGRDFFIRTLLEVPVHGLPDPFLWGVWMSVSDSNFRRYQAGFRQPGYRDSYPGWLSNRIPGYPDTLRTRCRARVEPGGDRPLLELEPTEHPLSVDSRQGIDLERAIRLASEALHGGDSGRAG